MDITAHPYSIELATPFVISRGAKTHCHTVRVTINYKCFTGVGECTPYPRYHESVDSVVEQIETWRETLSGFSPYEAKQHLQSFPAGAARNAIDCALWSLISQLENKQFPSPYFPIKDVIETAMTVSIGSPDVMANQAKQYVAKGAGLLKIKLDGECVVERVAAVRSAAPHCRLILDANEAWGELNLATLFDQLVPYDIAMIEQPLAADEDYRLADLAHPIPLCADESCHTRLDLEQLVGRYEMINIKLDKSGGLTEALLLEQKARQLGFRIMIGCMLGTSLAMKAALPIASRAEIVDLDGPVLLGQDVEGGLKYAGGALHLE